MSKENSEWPKEHIWQYKTANHSAWNLTRPFLHALTAWKSDGKISYWFDWQAENAPYGLKGILLPGDPTAPVVESPLDELRMHFGRWKNAYILEPKDKSVRSWQYGFLIPNTKPRQMSLCSLILEGPVRVLIGPNILAPFGMDLNHQEISIQTWCSYYTYYNNRDFMSIFPLI